MKVFYAIVCAAMIFSATGCQSVYYASMEKLGIEKRELMVDRVEEARDEQEEAKETFADALEAFTAVTEYQGGDLEAVYSKINAAYEDSLKAAERVSKRIDKVESVAEALFAEWEQELESYQSASLRSSSQRSLRETRASYNGMVTKMRKAEASMAPVVELFQDQVLYLKHNLNARAIAALDVEVVKIQEEVASLVKEMEASIDEANAFMSRL
ncbi:DUF2959 family protein [Coraliomargarita algicola]|uniref:DUF2959 family protein n=1 Tax=Coraliomargarita algicola TaxID=3092156 RepID=A0ABZ0REA6_9BACT|nr:DUF2959 family protein [Coraliomargarita sp. J2-16]WPJ94322.1 DUF2959 family protein [Coraliomargarita sp. J2-16]